jgi:predicted nucleic acid-binding protein
LPSRGHGAAFGGLIAETHRLTLSRAGLRAALRGLEQIGASRSVTVHFPTAAEHAVARDWLERLAPLPVTYTDGVSFAVMGAVRCTAALSFDRDFLAAGFQRWDPASG